MKNIKNIKITTSRHLKKIELFTQAYFTSEKNSLKGYLAKYTTGTDDYHNIMYLHHKLFRIVSKIFFFLILFQMLRDE